MSLRCERSGTSLVELAAAMWMTAAVATMVMVLLRTESRVAGHSADRAEVLDAARTAGAILAADLAPLDPSADLLDSGSDSVALRVFRGTAIVCGFAGADPLVRYRGLRQPEPDKDSLLVVTSGGERVDGVRDVAHAPGACVSLAGELVLRLRPVAPVEPGDLLFVFENGGYHISGAFRYRRGAGGRQPITADVFSSASRFTRMPAANPAEAAAIALDLFPAPSTRTLRGHALADRTRLRVAFRNGGPP
jgi:hypothetical protein